MANTGHCFTFHISGPAYTDGTTYMYPSATDDYQLVNAIVSSKSDELKFHIYIPLYETDWNFWNLTTDGYQIVPWTLDENFFGDDISIGDFYNYGEYWSP